MKQGNQNQRIAKGWDKMEFLLDKELPQKEKKKKRAIWLIFLSGLIIVSAFYFLISNRSQSPQPIAQVETNTSKSIDQETDKLEEPSQDVVNVIENNIAEAEQEKTADQKIDKQVPVTSIQEIKNPRTETPIASNSPTPRSVNKVSTTSNLGTEKLNSPQLTTANKSKENISEFSKLDSKGEKSFETQEKLQVNLNLVLKDIPVLQLKSEKDNKLDIPFLKSSALFLDSYYKVSPDFTFASTYGSSIKVDKVTSKWRLGIDALLAYNYSLSNHNSEFGIFVERENTLFSFGVSLHAGKINTSYFDIDPSKFDQSSDAEIDPASGVAGTSSNIFLDATNRPSYEAGWYAGIDAFGKINLSEHFFWNFGAGMNRMLYSNTTDNNRGVPITLDESEAVFIQQTGETLFRRRWEPFVRSAIGVDLRKFAIEFGTRRGLKDLFYISDNLYYNHNIHLNLSYKI